MEDVSDIRKKTISILSDPKYGLGWSHEKATHWEENIYMSSKTRQVAYKEQVQSFIENALITNKLISQGANL
jgi:hypothetical protein